MRAATNWIPLTRGGRLVAALRRGVDDLLDKPDPFVMTACLAIGIVVFALAVADALPH